MRKNNVVGVVIRCPGHTHINADAAFSKFDWTLSSALRLEPTSFDEIHEVDLDLNLILVQERLWWGLIRIMAYVNRILGPLLSVRHALPPSWLVAGRGAPKLRGYQLANCIGRFWSSEQSPGMCII